MSAHKLIKDEILKVGQNPNLASLKDFLERVHDGINSDTILNRRQTRYILSQISWYSTTGQPRVQPAGNGVAGEMATRDAHQKWLICPTTVNSFVAAINGMTQSAE